MQSYMSRIVKNSGGNTCASMIESDLFSMERGKLENMRENQICDDAANSDWPHQLFRGECNA
jgi:hypothetical protein